MDNFVVSARKYRPSTFDTVVGQSHITVTLKNAIKSNHLAQAFLFCGPRGVGKTTCARILAKTINCQNLSSETEACDQCDSCVSFTNSASFNIHELDAASNNSVDDIRNLVDQVRYPPQSGKYKIYIIDEVHMLSSSAFNAFLKTLEEPPSYAIFILATTEKHKIIPTILSRCQIFDFNRIQQQDISNHLAQIAKKENIVAEEEALQLIAQKADGGLRDALSMFDLIVTFSSNNQISYKTTIDNLHILDYDYYFRMTSYLLNGDIAQTLLTFDEILRKGFDGHNFVVGLSEHFRNLMVCKDAATLKLLQLSESIQKKYLAQADQSSLSFLLSALNIGSQCDLNYKASKNQRLHVELSLMKMAHIQSTLSLAKFGQMAKKKTDSVSESPESAPTHQPNPVVEVPITRVEAVVELAVASQATALATPPLAEVAVPQPIVQEPSSNGAYKPSTKLKSTIRLGNIGTATEEEVSQKPKEVQKEAVTSRNPFTLEQLKAAWNEFAAQKEAQGKQNEFVILDREITMKDATTIFIQLDHVVQMEQIGYLRVELLGFLKRKLQNSDIQLEAEIAVQENRKMIYTSQDKFTYLSGKHPVLSELKQTFGLDVDY